MFQSSFLFRGLSSLTIFIFLFTTICPLGYAQSTASLPVPGSMVGLSQSFEPVLLKGLRLHPEDPLAFTFIVEEGEIAQDDQEVRAEAERLVKYFMAALTVPSGDFWVNLSPIEPDRIIPGPLSETLLGRDMLAQDYILKQLTATLMYPEEETGRAFWERIYAEVQEKYGVSDIPMNTYNKIWIMPESASVYEEGNSVVVTGGRLKVMMEEDYVMQKNSPQPPLCERGGERSSGEFAKDVKNIIREVLLPEITREVNEGRNFAPLRQIYYSLILAKWYKQKVKDSLMAGVYVDQNQVSGIDDVRDQEKMDIYNRYVEAYKKGVFSMIREDYDPSTSQLVPRNYFSGGVTDNPEAKLNFASLAEADQVFQRPTDVLTLRIGPEGDQASQAMLTREEFEEAISELGFHTDAEVTPYAVADGPNSINVKLDASHAPWTIDFPPVPQPGLRSLRGVENLISQEDRKNTLSAAVPSGEQEILSSPDYEWVIRTGGVSLSKSRDNNLIFYQDSKEQFILPAQVGFEVESGKFVFKVLPRTTALESEFSKENFDKLKEGFKSLSPSVEFRLVENEESQVSEAMLDEEIANRAELVNNGGIDMNEIGVDSWGSASSVRFDPAAVGRILQSRPTTFRPVTVSFKSTAEPFSVLGISR